MGSPPTTRDSTSVEEPGTTPTVITHSRTTPLPTPRLRR